MKASGKYFDFQNKDRFLPLYEMKLEKIDFQRRALVENIRSHKFPADFEEIILLFNPSWRDPQVQKETEERMLLDPDFVRILEVQQ